jgi:hypothetical protein
LASAGEPLRHGACYGLTVRSSVELRYLRSGAGTEHLDVVEQEVVPPAADDEAFMQMRPGPDRGLPVAARIHRTESPGRYLVWVAGGEWFVVDLPGRRIEIPPEADALRREERLWGIPSRLYLLELGHYPLHAAAVEVSGRALVFGGPSRFGKTTLAAAFVRAGHRLLAEDLVDLVMTDRGVDVLPGPTMLRMRTDMARAVELPGAALIAEDADRAHFVVPDPLGGCAPVPLAGVVLLRRADGGAPRLRPSDPPSALRDIWSQGFALPTETSRTHAFTCAAAVTAAAPVWDLHRPLRVDTLDETVRLLVDAVTSGVPSHA